MIDIHRDKMSRKEFCWLTDPLPPIAETRSNTSLVLKWDPIRFCGVDVSVVSDSITYIIEGCEGQEWKGGIASKFVTDLHASDYKLIAKGSKLERIVLEDLKPARWYHFRLTIQYLSTFVTSQTKSFATICSPPNQPNQPYVYLIMNENNMFENKSRQDPQVRLTWNEPNSNGSAIKKYHVQIMEFYETLSSSAESNGNGGPSGNMKMYSQGSPESANSNSMEEYDCMLESSATATATATENRKESSSYTSSSGQRFLGNKWKTVYCNLLKSTLLEAPRPHCKAWGIRIRALNNSGWSSYSDVLYLDNHTHAQLFSATSTPTPTSKLPPLQKQSVGMNKSSSSSTVPRLHQSQSFPHSSTSTSAGKERGSEGGREYHNGKVDIWTASSSSFSSEKFLTNREGEKRRDGQEGHLSYRSSNSPTPNLKYNQPRCKTPSLLLPTSPLRQNSSVLSEAGGFPTQQSSQQNATAAPAVDSEILEKEVERYVPLPLPLCHWNSSIHRQTVGEDAYQQRLHPARH